MSYDMISYRENEIESYTIICYDSGLGESVAYAWGTISRLTAGATTEATLTYIYS